MPADVDPARPDEAGQRRIVRVHLVGGFEHGAELLDEGLSRVHRLTKAGVDCALNLVVHGEVDVELGIEVVVERPAGDAGLRSQILVRGRTPAELGEGLTGDVKYALPRLGRVR